MLNIGAFYVPILFRTKHKTEHLRKRTKGVRDMKKKSLRILSLIVAIVMVVAMLPLSALAEETGPKRKVGVVVYGAELTAVLTDIESAFHGNVDFKKSLDQIVDVATKVVDGTGVSVPDVDVSLTAENGKTYKMEEDRSIEIFTDTTEMYIGFQDEVDKQLTKLEYDLAALQVAMEQSNQLTAELSKQITDFKDALQKIREKMNDLKHDLVGMINGLKDPNGNPISLNGMLYRTYVTEEAVPANATYTVKVERFSDTDKDGNAITRDGYILYNDGLESGGSMFNTYRSFPVEVKEKGRFDHEIQFVGPLAGIEGTLNLPEAFDDAYDTFANAMNKMAKTAEDVKNAATNSNLFDSLANFIGDITKMGPIYDWFKQWTAPTFSTSDEISKDYRFGFPGLWCAESEAGFAFTDVDVAETGITGSEYLLVNRDELVDVLKFMMDLGKDAFQGALKATFGGEMTYADGTVKDYDSIVNLYFQLVKSEDGQLSLDYDTAFAIVKTYIGVISDMNLFDRVVDTDTGDILTPMKLKYPIPAFLQAASDENGVVKFNRDSNITLTWMLKIIPQITEKLGDADFVKDNKVLNLLMEVANYAAPIIDEYGSKIINTLVYPFAQRLGLVGKKFGSGTYIMFQTKAAEGYWINPLAYTMKMTWEDDTWLYVTVADLGLIVPYFTEAFHDFVRNTTFAGTIDKFLNQIAGKDINLIAGILDPEGIDITKQMGKDLTGALTAFVGQIGFESLGLDTIFSTKSDFVAGLNKYLYENGRTAQNLMIYVNKQAMRAKSVYAGYVTEDWYFYNLDKSPTTTATKLIDMSTKDIAAAFVNETKSSIVTKTGTAVSKVVNTIGTRVEQTAQNIRTQIKSTIGAAIQSVAQKAFDSVKTSITNFAKDMFSRLIHG